MNFDLLSLITLVAFLIGAYSGHANRLFGAAVILMNLVLATLVAGGFYLVLGGVMVHYLTFLGDSAWGGAYLLLFVLSIVAVTMFTDLYFKEPPKLEKNLDRIGGAVLGVGIGAILAGTLGVGWMLLPFFNGYAIGSVALGCDRLVVGIYRNVGLAAPGARPFDVKEFQDMYVFPAPPYSPDHNPAATLRHLCDGMMNSPDEDRKDFGRIERLASSLSFYEALLEARRRKGAQVFVSVLSKDPAMPKLEAIMNAVDGEAIYEHCDFTFIALPADHKASRSTILAWERDWEDRAAAYAVYSDGSVKKLKREDIEKMLDSGVKTYPHDTIEQ